MRKANDQRPLSGLNGALGSGNNLNLHAMDNSIKRTNESTRQNLATQQNFAQSMASNAIIAAN